jgi:hypothetical protein
LWRQSLTTSTWQTCSARSSQSCERMSAAEAATPTHVRQAMMHNSSSSDMRAQTVGGFTTRFIPGFFPIESWHSASRPSTYIAMGQFGLPQCSSCCSGTAALQHCAVVRAGCCQLQGSAQPRAAAGLHSAAVT